MSTTYVMSDDFAWTPPAPYSPRLPELCEHCQYEPRSQKSRRNLCSWCTRTERRKGNLPSTEEIAEHERRQWAKLSPEYTSGPKQRQNVTNGPIYIGS